MRLSFSLLWFDDNEDYFDSLDLDPLREKVLSWGFDPNIECVTTPEDFIKYSPFTQYDLIVVDRYLEGYKDGEEFIAELRRNAIYTEVIFYTAGNTSDLWNSIGVMQLEGVFVSHRNDVFSKIFKVGRQLIRKVLDLENMRGIIMAEVGELDHLLDRIITGGMETLAEEQQKRIFNKFYEKAAAQNKEHREELENFIKDPEVVNMLDLCDSYKRWSNFNRLKKEHMMLRAWENIGNYDVDILQPRNFLAHGKPKQVEAGGYLFTHHGKEYSFNENVSLSLRQTILRYKGQFSEMLESLDLRQG